MIQEEEIKKIIADNIAAEKLAENRHLLAEAWKAKSVELEKTLYFTRVFSMIAIGVLLCFGYHYHRQSKELDNLKSTIEKPMSVSLCDSISPLNYKDTIN